MNDLKISEKYDDREINFTEEQLNEALKMAMNGVSIIKITEHILSNSLEFTQYLERDVTFSSEFYRARSHGLEKLADDLIDIPDTYADVQRGRLKSENIKWLLSKRKSKEYGDRLDVHVTQTVDIADALSEAKSRTIDVLHSQQDNTTSGDSIKSIEPINKIGTQAMQPIENKARRLNKGFEFEAPDLGDDHTDE